MEFETDRYMIDDLDVLTYLIIEKADPGIAYLLFATPSARTNLNYCVTLASLKSEGNSDFVEFGSELFSTRLYSTHDTIGLVMEYIVGVLDDLASIESPSELVYALGGVINHERISAPTIINSH